MIPWHGPVKRMINIWTEVILYLWLPYRHLLGVNDRSLPSCYNLAPLLIMTCDYDSALFRKHTLGGILLLSERAIPILIDFYYLHPLPRTVYSSPESRFPPL